MVNYTDKKNSKSINIYFYFNHSTPRNAGEKKRKIYLGQGEVDLVACENDRLALDQNSILTTDHLGELIKYSHLFSRFGSQRHLFRIQNALFSNRPFFHRFSILMISLGDGLISKVYKGTLHDIPVAIKRVDRTKGLIWSNTVPLVEHDNITRLIGERRVYHLG